MLSVAEGGEFGFKRFDYLASNKPAAREYFVQSVVNLTFDRRVLHS
jgi:hypothetical protein